MKKPTQTSEEIIKKAEEVRFWRGENGKQYIDRFISEGYNQIRKFEFKSNKTGGKYFLFNEEKNVTIPISGALRKYSELVLKNICK